MLFGPRVEVKLPKGELIFGKNIFGGSIHRYYAYQPKYLKRKPIRRFLLENKNPRIKFSPLTSPGQVANARHDLPIDERTTRGHLHKVI